MLNDNFPDENRKILGLSEPEPMTVAQLRKLIKNLPGNMPVKVKHEPLVQDLGICDPIVEVTKGIQVVREEVGPRGIPYVAEVVERYDALVIS